MPKKESALSRLARIHELSEDEFVELGLEFMAEDDLRSKSDAELRALRAEVERLWADAQMKEFREVLRVAFEQLAAEDLADDPPDSKDTSHKNE